MATKPKRTEHRDLDQMIPHISGKGAVHVGLLFKRAFDIEAPTVAQVEAMIRLFETDDRFDLNVNGIASTVRMSDEPEDITAEAQATSQPDIPATEVMPSGEAAPIPSIGERIMQAEAQALAAENPEAIDLVETVEVEPTEERTLLARLQKTQAAIDAQTNAIEHISDDLKSHKSRLKVLEEERDALIRGEIPPTDLGEVDPSQTPIGKAISGEAPMIVDPPVEGMYRNAGATAAAQGKTEMDCPFVRETNAKGLSMWLDGFREAKRDDHSEREAQVQALFRDTLVEKCLPFHGMLTPGDDTPKVPTVTWDERPSLVLDMLADGEGPTPGVERWQILPTFDRDEWGTLFAETYGEPIALADKSDEAKARRIAGGIDCGKLIKCGRAKRVVGPLSRMSIAIVKVDQIAAAAAAGEQPTF